MRKAVIILGLGIILAGGTLFAMNYPNKWNDKKTELSKDTDEEICDECWTRKYRKNYGHDEIKVINNCSYNVTVSYEYWTDHWVPVKFGVDAGRESSWWPADSYRKFKCE